MQFIFWLVNIARMKLQVFILIILLQFSFLTLTIFSQHGKHYRDPFFGRVHQSWELKDNLPSSYVTSIFQSESGFIWLTTIQGLVQYDGLTFTTYNLTTNRELTGEHFTSIIEINPGELFLGSNGYGVFLFKNGLFTNIKVGKSVNSNTISKIYDTKEYGILICSEDGLFRYINGSVEQVITYPAVSSIKDMKVDRDGNLVLAVFKKGIVTLDKNFKIISERSFLIDEFKNPTSVYFDEKWNLWISTLDNLFYVSKGSPRKVFSGNQITKIEPGISGYLFITSDDGLISVNQETQTSTVYKNFSDRRVLSTFISKEDIIWVGTYNGLNSFRKSFINSISTDFGLGTNHVRAVYEDKDSNYWIGTVGAGLYKFDNRSRTLSSYSNLLKFKDIYSIYEDDDKTLWVASNNAFAKLTGDKIEVFSLGKSSGSAIRVITKNPISNELVLGTSNGEILSFNGNELKEIYKTDVNKDFIFSIVYTDSIAYIATTRGLFVVDDKMTTKHYSINQGLSVNSIRTIYKDDEGVVWIGTSGGGLSKRQNGRIYNYSTQDGLLSKYVWSIVEDNNSNFWLTSDEGISVINKNDIYLYDQKKIDKIPALMFGQLDGMIDPECNTGHNVGFRSSNEKIWFAGMGGVVIFHPDSLINSITPTPVYIRGISIDSKFYPPAESIEIPAGSTNIEVNFSTLNFGNNSHLNFRYKIFESNDEWIYTNKRSTIYLSNLNPGEYTLIIQADNGQEKWDLSEVKLTLIQLPKFYQTFWFRIFILLALGFFVFLFVKWRLKSLNAKNIELLSLIQNKVVAEEKLKDAFTYIQYVIDSIDTAIISIDENGNVTHSNKSADKFKNQSSNINSNDLWTLFPKLQFVEVYLKEAMNKREPKTYPQLIYIEQSIIQYFSLSIFPMEKSYQGGYVILIDDVSEQTKLQEVMIQSEKMLSVAGLAAGMAHEINNPLGTIVQGCQNILRRISFNLQKNVDIAEGIGINVAKIEEYFHKRQINDIVESMRVAASKASDIIKNMLQFSRRSESKMVEADIVQLINNTIELACSDFDLKKKFDIRSFEIVKEIDENLPLIPLTVTEIEQVLFNLIKNAVQAFKSNDKKTPKMVIRAYEFNKFVKIEVEDNGPGIPDNVKSRIFEPFFTTKDVGEGTGLGLSVSYMIIANNHNGRLSVESTEGVGAKFIIELPLQKRD